MASAKLWSGGALVRILFLLAVLAGPVAGEAGVNLTTVNIINESGQTQADVPVTFGHVFEPGDIGAGAEVGASLSDGTVLALQTDAKTTYGDGSLKHAVITVRLPNLSAGATETITLSSEPSGTSGPAVTLSDLLATSFDADVTLDIGGTAYSASARDLLSAGSPTTWLQGPLVTEWHVNAPVATSGGSPHDQLEVHFAVRAYAGSPIQMVRVDTAVEKNRTFVSGPNTITYNADIQVGGSSVYSQSGLAHHQHARWRKVFWWGGDPQVEVAHNSVYLRATPAVPNYDPDLTIPGSVLNSAQNEWQNANTAPMQPGLVYQYMPDGGGRPDIGPMPRWDARHVISQDLRAKLAVLGSGDLSGSWPIHYRDEGTGYPVTIDDYPTIFSNNLPGGIGHRSGTAGYTPDWAHEPLLGYYAYLITGDYYYLEELQFWATWNFITMDPGGSVRDGSTGRLDTDQVRSFGWGMRTLAAAAWITPDSHALKAYFEDKLDNNFDYLITRYIDNPGASPLGTIIPIYLTGDETSAWQDDFVTQALGWADSMGYAKAATIMVQWKGIYPVVRLGPGGPGSWCWAISAPYRVIFSSGGFQNPITDPQEAYEETLRNEFGASQANNLIAASCGSSQMFNLLGNRQNEIYGSDQPTDPESYVANLQAAIAVAVDSGVADSQAAWSRYLQSTNDPDYEGNPQFALTPRSLNGPPPPPAPTVSLNAAPATVAPNDNSTLTWSSTDATSCSASGDWSGSRATMGNEQVGPLANDTTYTLTCTGAGGSASRTVTVTVAAPGTPVIMLTAMPVTVQAGETSLLEWTATDANSCSASGAWTGNKGTSGNETVGPLGSTSTFTLTCTGAAGSTSESVVVQVAGAPTITLTANPTSIQPNQTSLLTWMTTDATSCTASGAWSGSKATSGNETVGPLSNTGTFTLSCTGAGGSANESVTVQVTGGGGSGGGGGSTSSSSGGGALGLLSLLWCLLALAYARRPRR